MAGSLEEGSGGDYRKEAHYGTFQSGVPQPVPPSQSPHYPSVTGLCIFSFDPFFFWFAQSSNNKSFQPRMHTVFLSSCRNSKTNSWDAFCIIEKLVFFSILVLYNCFGLVVLESVQDIRVCLRGNIPFMRGIEELCQIIICNFF